MATIPEDHAAFDDPRRLRELISRARGLASQHELTSVLVGLAGFEGDRLFPELVNFVESELRVDDSVFRMTRERAVLLLTDVEAEQAREIVDRLIESFRERFPAATEPAVACGYFQIAGGDSEPTAKDVLPELFASPPAAH